MEGNKNERTRDRVAMTVDKQTGYVSNTLLSHREEGELLELLWKPMAGETRTGICACHDVANEWGRTCITTQTHLNDSTGHAKLDGGARSTPG